MRFKASDSAVNISPSAVDAVALTREWPSCCCVHVRKGEKKSARPFSWKFGSLRVVKLRFADSVGADEMNDTTYAFCNKDAKGVILSHQLPTWTTAITFPLRRLAAFSEVV